MTFQIHSHQTSRFKEINKQTSIQAYKTTQNYSGKAPEAQGWVPHVNDADH